MNLKIAPIFCALAAVAAVLLINPLNWVPSGDDFAYVRTVKRLLDTGSYYLDDWSSANIVAQTYVAAFFATFLGEHFLVFLFTSLFITVCGTIGLYKLGIELGLEAWKSLAVVAAFHSCPLVLGVNFTFLSDMPFFSFVVLATLFYTRGLRTQAVGPMLIGSVFAALGILTRQNGMLLVVALFLAMLSVRGRRVRLFVAGAALPIVGTVLAFRLHQDHSSWAQHYSSARLMTYLSGEPHVLATNFLWRSAAVLQYAAFCGLPLVLVLVFETVRELLRKPIDRTTTARELFKLGIAFALFASASLLGSASPSIQSYDKIGRASLLFPSLRWNLYFLLELGIYVRVALTIATCAGAVILLKLLLRPAFQAPEDRSVESPRSMALLLWVSGLLLGFQLMFFQFGDQYLIALFPCGLIILARAIRSRGERALAPILASALVLALVGSAGVGASIGQAHAHWTLADQVRKESGTGPENVASIWGWAAYHGAFDRYVRSIDFALRPNLFEFGGRFLVAESKMAEYVITEDPKLGLDESQMIARTTYLDLFRRPVEVRAYRRSSRAQ